MHCRVRYSLDFDLKIRSGQVWMDTQMEPLMEPLIDPQTDPWMECMTDRLRQTLDGLLTDSQQIPDRLQEIDFKDSIWRGVKMSSPNWESCPNELSKFGAHLERSSHGPPIDP